MQHDWIQDRDAVIDPEANTSQQQSHSPRGGTRGRRQGRTPAAVFHDDKLRDERPPHFADATHTITREHLM